MIDIIKLCFVLFTFGVTFGQSDTKNQSRIVGGQKASETIPYQISLQVKVRKPLINIPFLTNDKEWAHNCGGSIIGEYHVLTAAHCVAGASPTRMSVVAGSSKRSSGGSRHLIESYIIHPNYQELVTSDIAIMKVKTPFEFGNDVAKIDFSDETLVDGGVPARLTGWGYTRPIRFGDLPEDLQEMEMETLSNTDCKERGMNVTDTEICTYKGFFRGACAGDSGGPLVVKDRSKQIGVVSYGTRICSIGSPDVFTRVSVFVKWINEQLTNL